MKVKDFELITTCAEIARQFDVKKNGFRGMTHLEMLDRGIPEEVISWCKKNHYISVHEGRDVWFAFKNPKHPDCTIDHLQQLIEMHKLNGDTDWQL